MSKKLILKFPEIDITQLLKDKKNKTSFSKPIKIKEKIKLK